MKRRIFSVPLIVLLLALAISAQQAQTASDLLTLDSLFTFRTRSLGPVQWQNDGSGVLMKLKTKMNPIGSQSRPENLRKLISGPRAERQGLAGVPIVESTQRDG